MEEHACRTDGSLPRQSHQVPWRGPGDSECFGVLELKETLYIWDSPVRLLSERNLNFREVHTNTGVGGLANLDVTCKCYISTCTSQHEGCPGRHPVGNAPSFPVTRLETFQTAPALHGRSADHSKAVCADLNIGNAEVSV